MSLADMVIARFALVVALAIAGSAGAPPVVRADESVRVLLAQLRLPTGRAHALRQLGEAWDRARREAAYDESLPAPRAFAAQVSPALVALLATTAPDAEETNPALRLLGDLADPSSEATVRERLASDDVLASGAAAGRTALVARAAARLHTAAARDALVAAFARTVPADDAVPAASAWSLCEAISHTLGDVAPPPAGEADPSDALDVAVRRLFRFAPHAALAACMPLLLRMPNLEDETRAVLDGRGWPGAMAVGPGLPADPRTREVLVNSGRGAALVLLAEKRAPDALRRLEAALRDRSLEAWRTRDGAVQGLGALGGPRARRILRAALADPALRSPRAVHALLRLGDAAAVRTLRALARDGSAEIELRLAAANAFTLLSRARADGASRYVADLERAGPLGPPFEALDARLASFAPRLVVAAACDRDLACAAGYLTSADAQMAARAFWDLTRFGPRTGPEAVALAEVAAATLSHTAPNTEHDRVAGAIALLAHLDPEIARPHLPAIRAAQADWEGRTNPMGLPFDIPLALAQLAGR